MAVLNLLYWPDATLRMISQPVIQALIDLSGPFVDEMIETMYDLQGAGLSAIQVGVDQRLFVLDVGLGPEVYYNPVITNFVGKTVPMPNEGCLSVPGFYATIDRYQQIDGYAQDRNGVRFEFKDLAGNPHQQLLRAHVIQHEIEHLDGKIFLDHTSLTVREKARQWMKKFPRRKSGTTI